MRGDSRPDAREPERYLNTVIIRALEVTKKVAYI